LQNLLAARLGLEEVRERHSDPILDSIDSALHDTAPRLRNTVTVLHPRVLAELGLAAAMQELVRQYEDRADFTIETKLKDVGHPSSQSLLYRAARELLANVHKHAGATAVSVRLLREDDRISVTVTDNRTGFDPTILNGRVPKGTSVWPRYWRGSTQWAVQWSFPRRSAASRGYR
jgi:two-component system NarL family sensor kinase